MALYKQKKFKEAVKCFKEVLRITPRNVIARDYLDMITPRISKEVSREAKPSSKHIKKDTALEKRTEKKVIKALKDSTQIQPYDSETVLHTDPRNPYNDPTLPYYNPNLPKESMLSTRPKEEKQSGKEQGSTNKELLNLLKTRGSYNDYSYERNKVKQFNDIRKKNPGVLLDFSHADFHITYLREANLESANLYSAYLSGADFSRANLSRANLSRANLSGAYLYSADLSYSNLSGAYLTGADLSDANLNSSIMIGLKFAEGYSRSKIYPSKVLNADFSNAIIDDEAFWFRLRNGNVIYLPVIVKNKKELRRKLTTREGFARLSSDVINKLLSASSLPE